MICFQRFPGPEAVAGKAFLHELGVDKGIIIPDRAGHSLVRENPLLLCGIDTEGVFHILEGLEIERRPGFTGGTLQKDGAVRMLMGAEISVQGVGQQNPAHVDKISRPQENRQRIPVDEIAGRDGVPQKGIVGNKKPATGHSTASLCL
jgi:hypothetical protein